MASNKREIAKKLADETARTLQKIREDAEISRKKLAQEVGCTTTTITRIEEREQIPGIELFSTICLALGKTSSEVFKMSETSLG